MLRVSAAHAFLIAALPSCGLLGGSRSAPNSCRVQKHTDALHYFAADRIKLRRHCTYDNGRLDIQVWWLAVRALALIFITISHTINMALWRPTWRPWRLRLVQVEIVGVLFGMEKPRECHYKAIQAVYG